jgi:hypothetical protein
MRQKYIVSAVTCFMLTVEIACANPVSLPQIHLCNYQKGEQTTISCAGLEVIENGCPINYTADGDFCLANDVNSEYPRLYRNKCPDHFEMVGARCVRPDIPQDVADGK